MSKGDNPFESMMHEAVRMEIIMTAPRGVIEPLVHDIMARKADEVICVINAAQHPTADDLQDSLLAVVKREVLFQALGSVVESLAAKKPGHIPFAVIDKFGTTVVMIAEPPTILLNAHGGSA